jgi:lysozyme family protein
LGESEVKEILYTINTYEGGLSDLKADRGGLTKFGISSKAHPSVDLATLTKERAVEIATVVYWTPLKCSQIGRIRLRWKLFDVGFHCGVDRAARLIQRVVGQKEDGIMGKLTVEAINAYCLSEAGEMHVLHGLCHQQMLHYVKLSVKDRTQIVFLEGWCNRAFDMGYKL